MGPTVARETCSMLLLGQAAGNILVQNAGNGSLIGTTLTASPLLQVKEILFRNATVDALIFSNGICHSKFIHYKP